MEGTSQVTSILDDTNSPRDTTEFHPVRDDFSPFKTDELRWVWSQIRTILWLKEALKYKK